MQRHRVLDLEPNDFTEAALEDLLFDRREQILRLFDRQLEIGVACDPERMPAEHLHSREERPEIRADDLLERNEMVRSPKDWHPTREALRDLDPREMILSGFRITNLHGERERQIRDVRERVTGIDGERRQNRKDLRLEVFVERAPFACREIGHPNEANAVRGKLLRRRHRSSVAARRAAPARRDRWRRAAPAASDRRPAPAGRWRRPVAVTPATRTM